MKATLFIEVEIETEADTPVEYWDVMADVCADAKKAIEARLTDVEVKHVMWDFGHESDMTDDT